MADVYLAEEQGEHEREIEAEDGASGIRVGGGHRNMSPRPWGGPGGHDGGVRTRTDAARRRFVFCPRKLLSLVPTGLS